MIVILDNYGKRHFLKGGEVLHTEKWDVGHDEYRVQLRKEPSNPVGKIDFLYVTRKKKVCDEVLRQIDETIKSGGGTVFIDIPKLAFEIAANGIGKAKEPVE